MPYENFNPDQKRSPIPYWSSLAARNSIRSINTTTRIYISSIYSLKIKTMKRITLIAILILAFQNLIAPPISKSLTTSNKLFALSEIKRWATEKEEAFKKLIYKEEIAKWKHLMGFKEASNNWTLCNDFGYMGLYQFCSDTLEKLGFTGITPEKFKADPSIFSPDMQDEALMALIRENELSLKNRVSKLSAKRFEDYIGETIQGVVITKGGLLAAAHLAGIGGVQLFLTGSNNFADCNGTSVSKYMSEFSQFNI